VDLGALAVSALPAFIASAVEFVEAMTIILAVGVTRGWRAPLYGTIAATITLAIIIAVLGVTIVTVVPELALKAFVGALLLLFGLRWLRKAVLRFAGIVAIHDEEQIYLRQVAELKARGEKHTGFDRVGAIVAYKAVLLEGTEVAFIVIAFGAGGPAALNAAVVGSPRGSGRSGRATRSRSPSSSRSSSRRAGSPFACSRSSFRAARRLRRRMSSGTLKAIWETVWGLLVEDGSLAVGIVLALAVTGLISRLVADPAQDQIGWLLLAILVVLVVFNLRAAGLRARGGTASGE